MEQQDKFEAWGILELFGRLRLAGKISEQVIAGQQYVRIDVPAVGNTVAYTRFFSQGAIYGITIVSEEIAMRMAAGLRAKPIEVYEFAKEEIRITGPQGPPEFDFGDCP